MAYENLEYRVIVAHEDNPNHDITVRPGGGDNVWLKPKCLDGDGEINVDLDDLSYAMKRVQELNGG